MSPFRVRFHDHTERSGRRPHAVLLFAGALSTLIGLAGCGAPADRSIAPDPALQELPAIASSPALTDALAQQGGTHVVASYTVGAVAGAVAIDNDTCYSAVMDPRTGPAVATIPIPRATGGSESTDADSILIGRTIGYYGIVEADLDDSIRVLTYCGPRGAAITVTGATFTAPPTLTGAAELLRANIILITPDYDHSY